MAVSIRGCGDSIGASPDDAPDLAYRIQDNAPNLRFAGLCSRRPLARWASIRQRRLTNASIPCQRRSSNAPACASHLQWWLPDGSPARRAASPSICPGAGPGVSRSVAPWPDCAPCHSQPDGGRLQPARQPHPPATPTSPKLAPDRPQTGPVSVFCCVLSRGERLDTTTADRPLTPTVQNLPGQSLLHVPYLPFHPPPFGGFGLSRAIAHSELTDKLTHRLWGGYVYCRDRLLLK